MNTNHDESNINSNTAAGNSGSDSNNNNNDDDDDKDDQEDFRNLDWRTGALRRNSNARDVDESQQKIGVAIGRNDDVVLPSMHMSTETTRMGPSQEDAGAVMMPRIPTRLFQALHGSRKNAADGGSGGHPRQSSPTAHHSIQQHIVKHCYHDHANDEEVRGVQPVVRGGITTPFPVQLHHMLSNTEEDGFNAIVSWQPHGRCFVVRDIDEFVRLVLPKYFKQSKFPSFQRQLNLYGFLRLTKGPDKGGYYHELFLRDRLFLTHRIQRFRVKGNGVRARSNPNQEPNFYDMPSVGPMATSVASDETVTMEDRVSEKTKNANDSTDEEDRKPKADSPLSMDTTTNDSATAAAAAAATATADATAAADVAVTANVADVSANAKTTADVVDAADVSTTQSQQREGEGERESQREQPESAMRTSIYARASSNDSRPSSSTSSSSSSIELFDPVELSKIWLPMDVTGHDPDPLPMHDDSDDTDDTSEKETDNDGTTEVPVNDATFEGLRRLNISDELYREMLMAVQDDESFRQFLEKLVR